MKARVFAPELLILVVSALFLMSCLLPGMIPLESKPSGSMPKGEVIHQWEATWKFRSA